MRIIEYIVRIGDLSITINDPNKDRQRKSALEELKKMPNAELEVTEKYFLDVDGREYCKIRDLRVYTD